MKAFRNIDMRDPKTKVCLAGGWRPYTACAFYKHKKDEKRAICMHGYREGSCQRTDKKVNE